MKTFISRLLPQLSLVAIVCSLSPQVQAATATGSFVFDGQTVHYTAFSGKDEAFFQSFKSGGILEDFENVAGVTPLQVTDYSNVPVNPVNLVDPKKPLNAVPNGIFYSSGGQTPGDPGKLTGTPAPTVLVNLDADPPGSPLQGAHSGTHVLAPSNFGSDAVQFSGSFFSFGVPSADKFSRIGWWTNPLMSAPPSALPNFHAVHNNLDNDDNFLSDIGVALTIQPGDFFAVAFDQPILQEVEFATAPDHYTLDDVVYSRDKRILFSPVPEPSSLLLMVVGSALLLFTRALALRRRRAAS